MKTFTRAAAEFALLSGLAATAPTKEAEAYPIQPPVIVEGKHVYTVPEGFNPPTIDTNERQKIEDTIREFRYKYYVVLVEKVDGPSDNNRMDKIMDEGVSSVVGEWKRRYPGKFDDQSLLFVQAMQPRKYRFWSGSELEKLGFYKSTHGQFNEIFIAHAKNNAYSEGIMKMGLAVDSYLSGRVYPNQNQGVDPINEPREAKPKKKTESTPDKISTSSPDNLELDRQIKELLEYLAWIVGVALPLLYGFLRTRNNRRALAKFQVEVDEFEMKIAKAERYMGELNKNREILERFEQYLDKSRNDKPEGSDGAVYRVAHRELAGETATLFHGVANGIDKLYLGIALTKKSLEACKKVAQKGRWWNRKPVEQATLQICDTAEFSLQELEVDPCKLFVPLSEEDTRQVKINPLRFLNELDTIFRQAQQGSKELMESQIAQQIDVRQAFPQDLYQQMHSTLVAHKIPLQWLEKHPLHGADKETAFYAELESVRRCDPVQYTRSIKKALEKEKLVADVLTQLVQLLEQIDAVEILALNLPNNTVVETRDNPEETLKEAKHAAARFRDSLKNNNKIKEVEPEGQKAIELSKKAKKQLQDINDAIHTIDTAIKTAETIQQKFSAEEQKTAKILMAASQHHPRVERPSLDNARDLYQRGFAALEAAKDLVNRNKHLEAKVSAYQAIGLCQDAIGACNNIIAKCNKLDELKKKYLAIYRQLAAKYTEAVRQMREYNSRETLEGYFHLPEVDSVTNYEVAIKDAENLMEKWGKNIKNAKKAYEEEEEERQRGSRDDYQSSGGNMSGGDY